MHAYMRERRGSYTLFYDESFMNRNVVTSVTSVSFFTEMCRFVQEKGQDEEHGIYEAHQGCPIAQSRTFFPFSPSHAHIFSYFTQSRKLITFAIFTESRTHFSRFHAIMRGVNQIWNLVSFHRNLSGIFGILS